MLARALTFAIDGLDSRAVSVEVDIRPGLPAFAIVGLGDAAVRESRERVRAAVLNSGFEFPQRRITANLAPAHLRKAGPGFDLALACAILAASGQVDPVRLRRCAVFAELSLGGELRACRGTLAVAEGARRAGVSCLILAHEQAWEAALVDGLSVAGLATLGDVAAVLDGGPTPPVPRQTLGAGPPPPRPPAAAGAPQAPPDLAEVRGHAFAIRALTVAAAGAHNLLLCGPPGTGKTMLARRLPSILPPLGPAEALEVTRIHQVAGRHPEAGLVTSRPFRAPHHSISASGLVGGGPQASPGEASLAHHGVLFLDELSEFSRPTLEALRQPLEDGRVAIVRGQHTAVYPTGFMLVAATNPCPCGYRGDDERCRCSEADLARHRRRLSGPLLDRLDLLVPVQRPGGGELKASAITTSQRQRELVLGARAFRRWRLRRATVSAARPGRRSAPAVDHRARSALQEAYQAGLLSARGHARVLRVARTVADLCASEPVRLAHVLEALALRHDQAGQGRGVA